MKNPTTDTKNESSSKTVKKKKVKKRRRVSKHIIATNSKSAAGPLINKKLGNDSPSPSSKTQSKPVVKDPKEAITYLEQWKNSRGNWKFNKNTQSWLIRHMYNAAFISKHNFEVLLEYLQDSHTDVQKRLSQDATQRAVRYQRHVDAIDKPDPQQDQEEDEIYQKMTEHDKRKEYKRARKLLDALKM